MRLRLHEDLAAIVHYSLGTLTKPYSEKDLGSFLGPRSRACFQVLVCLLLHPRCLLLVRMSLYSLTASYL